MLHVRVVSPQGTTEGLVEKLAAAGHFVKSRPLDSGAGSPVRLIVPSTLPVGPW